MNKIFLLIISFIMGTVYYYIMESSIPKKSNCSFIASPLTDIIAFIVGFFIIYKGYIYNDDILIILGSIIIIEHIWQLIPKFTLTKFF